MALTNIISSIPTAVEDQIWTRQSQSNQTAEYRPIGRFGDWGLSFMKAPFAESFGLINGKAHWQAQGEQGERIDGEGMARFYVSTSELPAATGLLATALARSESKSMPRRFFSGRFWQSDRDVHYRCSKIWTKDTVQLFRPAYAW